MCIWIPIMTSCTYAVFLFVLNYIGQILMILTMVDHWPSVIFNCSVWQKWLLAVSYVVYYQVQRLPTCEGSVRCWSIICTRLYMVVHTCTWMCRYIQSGCRRVYISVHVYTWLDVGVCVCNFPLGYMFNELLYDYFSHKLITISKTRIHHGKILKPYLTHFLAMNCNDIYIYYLSLPYISWQILLIRRGKSHLYQ